MVLAQENVDLKESCSCILHSGQKYLSKGEILIQAALQATLHLQGHELLLPPQNS